MRNRNGRQLQHYYNSYRRFPPKKLWESGSWPDFTSPRFSNRCVVDFLTSHRRLSCQTVSRNIWALCVRGSRLCSAENAETQPLDAKKLVVKRKGLSAAFLPKISAEIRQKDFLIRNVLSVFLQKEAISAERCSFGRNNLFLQPDYLKMRHCFAMKGTSGLQKEAVSAETTSFCRN